MVAFRLSKIEPPSEDKRWKLIGATMRRNGFRPSALIETLHSAQSAFGFLDLEALRYIGESLKVPFSKVYGVATFYQLFQLKPPGEHSCVICTGTACFIKGADQLLQAIKRTYGVAPGETTSDGKVSILTARCIGACGISAAGSFDGKVQGKLSESAVTAKINEWIKDDEPRVSAGD